MALFYEFVRGDKEATNLFTISVPNQTNGTRSVEIKPQ